MSISYTYILFSKTRNRYYIGYTSDSLENRIKKHNTNHKGYTGNTNDWEIVYYERYESKHLAYKRERDIKKQKSRSYIEKLIANFK